MQFPPPSYFRLPTQYTSWRRGQSLVISRLLESPHRFSALVAPTGSGKSLDCATLAVARDYRSIILCSTRSQQDQWARDFASLGWVDIRGQSNYLCMADISLSVAQGPCHSGITCDLRESGCLYYDKKRVASKAEVVISNYAFWLAENAYGQGIGPRDLLILDEAHTVPEQLANFLSVVISKYELSRYLQSSGPGASWRNWAAVSLAMLRVEVDETRPDLTDRKKMQRLREQKDLVRKLAQLATLQEPNDWVMQKTPRGGIRWDPITPGDFAEGYLFRQIPRVILVSATIREKTMSLLGLSRSDYDMIEQDSSFPVSRRPVIHVPTARMTHTAKDHDVRTWLRRIDQIIGGRQDRKGIIHSVSYKRKNDILSQSKYRLQMLHNSNSEQTAEIVAQYKKSSAPRILISPSVSTGLDFPYTECEYQIIAKVPFPDQRSAILKARTKRDREYPYYLAMQELVQAVGRGMRAEDDRCETIVIDDSFQWFVKRYKRFAPSWFLRAIVWKKAVPPTPPKLKGFKK